MQHISPTDAAAVREEQPEAVVFLDCREPQELQIAAIEGALHIPLAQTPGRLHEIPQEKEVIVFCHSGIRSQTVTAYLQQEGYSVKNMLGGIDAWSLMVDETVPRY